MRGRIVSTLLLWTLIGVTLRFFGGYGVVWLTALAAALTLYEFYQMLARTGHLPMAASGIVFGVVIIVSQFYVPEEYLRGAEMLAPAVLWCSLMVLRRPRGNAINSLAATLTGLVLIPFTFLFLPMIVFRFGEGMEGMMLALWVVAVAKCTDAGALMVGMAIGRHKMAPNLSPKKTWEGAIGGVVVGTGIAAALVAALHGYYPAAFTPTLAALLAPAVSISTIYADLLESAFKRESGVKDSGNIVPGIGGVFDLTDSFVLAAPVGYFALVAVLG